MHDLQDLQQVAGPEAVADWRKLQVEPKTLLPRECVLSTLMSFLESDSVHVMLDTGSGSSSVSSSHGVAPSSDSCRLGGSGDHTRALWAIAAEDVLAVGATRVDGSWEAARAFFGAG